MNAAEQRELIVFRVDSEAYALDLAEVREVTRVPEMESPGVAAAPAVGVAADGDGRIVLVSARERLGYPDANVRSGRMIVVRLPGGLEIGLLVEQVREVVTVSREAVLPPPALFGEGGKSRVRSLVRLANESLLLLVSTGDLFSSAEVERLEAAGTRDGQTETRMEVAGNE